MRPHKLARYPLFVCLLLCGLNAASAQDLADVIDRVRPSIVTIEASAGRNSSLGTGFIIRRDGLVLTAAHVIKDANQIRIRFHNGRTASVERIIAEDSDQDFALLKLAGGNYPALSLGSSNRLRQGQRVLALGNPLGLEFTATEGIISALRDRQLRATQTGGDPVYVQISAAISPGNSGGPVMNLAGEAVGVAIFKRAGGENLNFALAIDRIKPILLAPPPPVVAGPSPGAAPGSAAGSGEAWFVIASKARNLPQVYGIIPGTNPLGDLDWLHGKWNEGFKITDIAEGRNRWVIVMTKTAALGHQHVFTDAAYPAALVKKYWDESYYVTNALWGGDRWLVVMSKHSGYTQQSYLFSAQFPHAWVQEKQREGYAVTIVNGDGRQWLVVMTRTAGLGHQVINVFEETPRAWIRQQWDAGYYITSVGTNGGRWAVVMSRGAGFEQQSWWSGDTFPTTWVKEQWGNGWDVTGIR